MDQTGSPRSYPTSTTARCRKDRKAQGPEKDRTNPGVRYHRYQRARALQGNGHDRHNLRCSHIAVRAHADGNGNAWDCLKSSAT
eukprot:366437-Chlamydomonas_euryale.AAC.4